MRNDDMADTPMDAVDGEEAEAPQVPALEPDTAPSHPLRAKDVPGFIPKLIG